jgi:hypothetical protein
MQQPLLPANRTPGAAPDAIKVLVRSSRGHGSRVFVVEAHTSGTIADLKRLLCRPPLSMCSLESSLVLVVKGEGAAVARGDSSICLSLTRF